MLNAERADIAEGSEEVGDEDVGGDDADKVVGDEGPYSEFSTMGNGSSGKQGQDKKCRVPGCRVLAMSHSLHVTPTYH
jgi:hypothetical protein